MVKIATVVTLIAFIITGACLADEIKGKVSSVDKSKKTLQISGVIIQADEAWIEDERDYPLAPSGIASGDYIEVDGKFTGSSEMKASKIDRKKPECAVIKGKVSSMDIKKREIIISGITIKVPANAWLEGPNNIRIPLELFAPGYSVECRGDWTGVCELTAFKVSVE
jgi:ribosomal protein L24